MMRAGASQSPFLPAWVWLIPFALIVFIFEALQPGPGDPAKSIAWYSLLIIFGTAALTRICRLEKEFDLFEPLHLTFALFVLFYPVRALFAVWLDDAWFDPATAAPWRGLSASALGYICFAIAYKIGPKNFAERRRIWLDRSWDYRRANVASLTFLVLGVAGFLAMRLLSGSFFYFISLDPDIKSPQELKPWFYYLFWMCQLIQVGALIQFGAWLSTGRRTLWTAFYSILALLSTFLVARLFTVLCLTMLALGWHYRRRRIKAFQVAILSFATVAYLGVAGFARDWISPAYNAEETGELAELAGQQSTLVLHYVVANLEEFYNLSEVISITPAEMPYQLGWTFAAVVLKPIPRVLMPSKPLGASALFTQQVTPDNYASGLVTGIGAWGEWYLNFSWLGLVFGFALTGALSSALYRAMRATTEYSRVLLYGSFVTVLFIWLRNDFNSAITDGLYYFIPIVVALAYITSDRSASRSAIGRLA